MDLLLARTTLVFYFLPAGRHFDGKGRRSSKPFCRSPSTGTCHGSAHRTVQRTCLSTHRGHLPHRLCCQHQQDRFSSTSSYRQFSIDEILPSSPWTPCLFSVERLFRFALYFWPLTMVNTAEICGHSYDWSSLKEGFLSAGSQMNDVSKWLWTS